MKRILSLHLLLTAVAWFLWFLACPTYRVEGNVQHRQKRSRPPYERYEIYEHRDPTVFWAGAGIIMLLSASSCLYFASKPKPNPPTEAGSSSEAPPHNR